MSAERVCTPESLIRQSSKEAILCLVRRYPDIEEICFTFYQRRLPDPPKLMEKLETGATDVLYRLKREQVLSGGINELLVNCETGRALGINSKAVFRDGRKGQIPVMDFRCAINKCNQVEVANLIKDLRLRGFLIQASCSYHFIGAEIMFDNREWERFLGQCLLSNLVDQRYIGHCLDAGYSTLRLSSNEGVARQEPTIVDFVL